MAKSVIKFLKTRNVLSPTRSYEFDAGIDFYVPKFEANFIKNLKEKNSDMFSKLSSENDITFSSVSFSIEDNKSKSKVEYDLSDKNDSVIKFDEKTGKNYFLLSPHSRILIPSGIQSRMEKPGRALIAANKSGVASKSGLIFSAQVVDYTYQGEIHIGIINTSLKVVRIYEDMKLIQFLETPIFNSTIEIVDGLKLNDTVDGLKLKDTLEGQQTIAAFYKGLQDDRGEEGFGSSDK